MSWSNPMGAITNNPVSKMLFGGKSDVKSYGSSEDQQLQQAIANRPEMERTVGPDGQLKEQYRVKNPYENSSVLPGMKSELDGIKDLNVADIGYQGDIKSGARYDAGVSGLDHLNQQAYSDGPTEVAQNLYDQNSLTMAGARDNVSRDTNISTNQAMDSMAMRGGVGSGAGERMARNAQRSSMDAIQGLGREGRANDLSIGLQDAQYKQALQQSLPGMNMQFDAYQTGLDSANRADKNNINQVNMNKNLSQGQFNTNTGLNKVNMYADQQNKELSAKGNADVMNINSLNTDLNKNNAHNLDVYNTGIQAMGSAKTADAMLSSGGKDKGLLGNTFGMVFGNS